MHHTFHHIPKTGGSTIRIRLEDRADKKQISKLDYAIGHNTTHRTPGMHFTWLRNPLDRDISQFNYDMNKGEAVAGSFEQHCEQLSGNFITLWLHKNYLCLDPTVDMHSKYLNVQQCLRINFKKVFSLENIEESWDEISNMLNIDKEPRDSTNRSNIDYIKYISKDKLSDEFLSWHREYNKYDFKLFEEFCT